MNTHETGGYCKECEREVERCNCEECAICGERGSACNCPQCDECGRAMPRASDTGICMDCEIRWAATHQLGGKNVGGASDVCVSCVPGASLSLEQTESLSDWYDHTWAEVPTVEIDRYWEEEPQFWARKNINE
jgi:hypothetical protein